VIVGLRDPFPLVDGGGLARLREAGVEVLSSVAEAEVRRLNAPYMKRLATGRPYVVAKWAMTLDGRIATASGDSRWISNPASRSRVHELRGRVDAIVVGIGTALIDDPELTARPAGPRVATRVVLDAHARLALSSRLARTARETPVLVAVTPSAPSDRVAALEAAGCEITCLDGTDRIPVGQLLETLARRGATNVLVEGGGRTLGAFLDAGEIDEVWAFIAPLLEGGDQSHAPLRGRGCPRMAEAARLADVRVRTLDGDVWIEGILPQPWRSAPGGPTLPP
jgi:diaminohydroxyphosphoribosylaminopyrimidine deaminase/5-amino-6-(5-phosphoribosylamino)uracil reductase